MDRGLGGTPVTKAAGPLRCPTCERVLRPVAGDRYVCPCCGELFLLIDTLVGAEGPWGNGLVRSGMGVNDAGSTTALPARHVCDPPRRRGQSTQAETLWGDDPYGR